MQSLQERYFSSSQASLNTQHDRSRGGLVPGPPNRRNQKRTVVTHHPHASDLMLDFWHYKFTYLLTYLPDLVTSAPSVAAFQSQLFNIYYPSPL